MELDYASKSTGNAALTTGIIGTGLGAMNLLGNIGNFANTCNTRMGMSYGGCNGGNYSYYNVGNDCGERYVGRNEFKEALGYEKQLSDKNLIIAGLEAEKISDAKDVEVYKQIKSEMNALEAAQAMQIAEINKQLTNQAVQNQANKDSFQIMQERLDNNFTALGGAIEREVATRKANDNLIVNYVNSTFTPKTVVSTAYSGGTISPTSEQQQRYNPLPCCDCNE